MAQVRSSVSPIDRNRRAGRFGPGQGVIHWQVGARHSLHCANGGVTFLVRYGAPDARHSACEKNCPTERAALTFCVILRNLGGNPMEMLQLIHGQSDAVLDGRDLEEAIDRQRTRLETEAVPPWR